MTQSSSRRPRWLATSSQASAKTRAWVGRLTRHQADCEEELLYGATHPETPPELLDQIARKYPFLVAMNPNASQATLRHLLHKRYDSDRLQFGIAWAIQENPSCGLLALEDPRWAQEVEDQVQVSAANAALRTLRISDRQDLFGVLVTPWLEWLADNALDPDREAQTYLTLLRYRQRASRRLTERVPARARRWDGPQFRREGLPEHTVAVLRLLASAFQLATERAVLAQEDAVVDLIGATAMLWAEGNGDEAVSEVRVMCGAWVRSQLYQVRDQILARQEKIQEAHYGKRPMRSKRATPPGASLSEV